MGKKKRHFRLRDIKFLQWNNEISFLFEWYFCLSGEPAFYVNHFFDIFVKSNNGLNHFASHLTDFVIHWWFTQNIIWKYLVFVPQNQNLSFIFTTMIYNFISHLSWIKDSFNSSLLSFVIWRHAPRVMPLVLLCCPVKVEADAGSMAVEAEPSHSVFHFTLLQCNIR